MDIEVLISRLTGEIQRHLQQQERRQSIFILASRTAADQLRLPAELQDDRLIYCDDPDLPPRTARRIVPLLRIAQLADLARGTAGDAVSQALLAEVLAGRQVEVLAYEHRCYRETAPPALYRLYESQARQLAEFGIRPYRPIRPVQSGKTSSDKRLITERDIRALLADGVTRLQVGRTWRLTPLAEDCARDNHLLLEREEGEPCL